MYATFLYWENEHNNLQHMFCQIFIVRLQISLTSSFNACVQEEHIDWRNSLTFI